MDLKSGLTLEQLAAELTRQNDAKADYMVSTRSIKMESCGASLFLRMVDAEGNDRVEPLEVGEIAHRQIGAYLGIHSKYYNKMLEQAPGLLSHNANHWFNREPEERMVRTLDGVARAFLSNRYRRIDNYEIASAVLPIIGEMPDARFESCQITENRMYIKVINPRLVTEVVPGDIVQAGLVITNSETGQGAFSVQPLIYRLVCSNGMTVNDAAIRRNHVGRVTSAEENFLIYRDETIAADDRAFLMKVQDTVRSAVDEVRFHQVVGLMREAKDARMNTADVPGVVKLAAKNFSITESESGGVLQHLVEGNDLTLYGLSNAVTRYSQDVPSYDRASELEAIGYNVLSMGQRQWNRLNQAA
jgi:hypothetical protein